MIYYICYFISRDIGYYPFYFQGYGMLCSIFDYFQGHSKFRKISYGNSYQITCIRETCQFTSRDMKNLVLFFTGLAAPYLRKITRNLC